VTGHASAEALADFRAGLLPAREADAISAHLSTCSRCAALDAQLASVSSLLAATRTPPMPAALVARLDAALAAEAAARAAGTDAARAGSAPPAIPSATVPPPASPAAVPPATGPDPLAPDRAHAPQPAAGPALRGTTAPPGIPSPSTPPPGRRRPAGARDDRGGPGRGGIRPRSRLALRLATAAAAVVLVAGGGYAIAQLVSGGTPTTTAGPTAAAEHGETGQSAASRSAASGLAPAARPPAGLLVVQSGTRYRIGLLPTQVRSVLHRFAGLAPAPSAHGPEPAAAPAAFPQLAACVRRVAGAAMPRLVDIASYGGRPVAVIVVPVAGSSTVRVWLVGMACSAPGGDVITHFSMPGTG
jgi:hypothetical protein